jgi:hypothetical protein
LGKPDALFSVFMAVRAFRSAKKTGEQGKSFVLRLSGQTTGAVKKPDGIFAAPHNFFQETQDISGNVKHT